MATDFERWASIGQSVGLEGVELRQFITQQQADERDRRVEEREIEKSRQAVEMEEKRLAAEERKRVSDLEEKRLAAEREIEKARLASAAEIEEKRLAAEERKRAAELEERRLTAEIEERKRVTEAQERRETEERRVQVELKKLELESSKEIEIHRLEVRAENSRSTSDNSFGDGSSIGRNKVIQLPMFEEEKDDLDTYISRFERTCVMYGVRSTDWSTQLARLLKGTALEVYQRIPEESFSSYDVLKYALLKRFQMTEGGYIKRFLKVVR